MAKIQAIKRIVVGLDGSSHSLAALNWAIRIASGMHAEVIAVYALDLPSLYPEPYMIPLQFDEGWRKTMKAEFEDSWCEPLRDARVRYRAVMDDGRAATVISRVAEAKKADLIVVGRRGRGGIAEILLGSVTHELVLRSRIPVVVVEPEPAEKSRRARAA